MKSVAILAQICWRMQSLRRALEVEPPSLALTAQHGKERRRTCTWPNEKLWGKDLDGEFSEPWIAQAGRR